MEVLCSKGCGYSVTVTAEALQEMIELGGTVTIAHEVCPNSEDAPKRSFRIVTHVYESFQNEPDRDDELLASMGDGVVAPTFHEAVEPLGVALQEQWTRIVGMTTTIDAALADPFSEDYGDDFDMSEYIGSAAEKKELAEKGYGRCAGCGGQEPTEVLQQMDGYCTSECERDHE